MEFRGGSCLYASIRSMRVRARHTLSGIFRSWDCPKGLLFPILKRFQGRKTAERKSGSGKTPIKMPPAAKKRLARAAADKTRVSQRKQASKYSVSQPYICRVLKKQGVKYYKKDKAPHWTPAMDTRQGRCCRKITRVFLFFAFVPKVDNPPSVPKLCPIEDFWGVFKQAVAVGSQPLFLTN